MRPVVLLGCVLLTASACDLREITLATPADLVIAEVILRAGAERQTAYLHRTSTGHGDARVPGAHITITDVESGESYLMDVDRAEACLDPAPDPQSPSVGTCYSVLLEPGRVRAGRAYTLRIELPGGGTLTGRTTVPADFAMLAPDGEGCLLQPDTTTELAWSMSEGAVVYIVEAWMPNLRDVLRERGEDVPGTGPVELLGLAVTAEDTTLVFPSELGLFDRFDDEVHPILVAIRDGLPPGLYADVSVAATDRNYVNWVRGGNFNPSGQVRVSSLRGDGAGVFGSMVTRSFTIDTPPAEGPAGSESPPCR